MSGYDVDNTADMGQLGAHELACRAHSGCSLAFAELTRRYRPRLLRLLEQRLSGRLADAEDVAQEAFARAWQRIRLYDHRYRFCTWLYTIALRLATDYQRRERRTARQLHLVEEQDAVVESPVDAAAQHRELSGNIWATAQRVLSEPQYTALWLRYGEDMTVREVAQVTRRTQVGVRVLLHRARLALQPHLAAVADVATVDGGTDAGEGL